MLAENVKRIVLAALFAAGVWQAWRHLPLDVGIIGDDQAYFFVSERAASGVPPHVSLVDHKHQLTALVSSLPIRVGRWFGADDVLSGRVASIAAASGTVVLLFLLVESLCRSSAAGLIASLVALHFRMFFSEAAMGYRPQLFMAFFATGALTAFARRRHATAGALAAASFLCWQPAGLVGAAMVFAILGTPDWRRSFVRIAAGGIAVVAAYELYFLLNGALLEQLRQSYLMASTGELAIRPLTESFVFIISGDPRGWSLTRPDHIAGLLLVLSLFFLGLHALLRPFTTFRWWRRDAAWRAVLLVACGSIAFTCIDHQAYPDQFFILPFVAVAAGALFHLVTRILWFRPVQFAATVAMAALLGKTFIEMKLPVRPLVRLSDQRALAKRLTDYAHDHGGSLWVVGRPDLLGLQRRSNYSPFGVLLDKRVRDYAVEKLKSYSIRPLVAGRPPEVIVLARLASGEHLEWVRREYQAVSYEGFDQRLRLMLRRAKPIEPQFPVTSRPCGDPVGPRPDLAKGATITATDALYILNAALSKRPCPLCVCDTNGSRALTAADALGVIARASGKDKELKCPACPPRPLGKSAAIGPAPVQRPAQAKAKPAAPTQAKAAQAKERQAQAKAPKTPAAQAKTPKAPAAPGKPAAQP